VIRRVVVDASVVVKWFVPEGGEAEALGLLDAIRAGDAVAIAPDLLLAETANVLWKRVAHAKEITATDASAIMEAVLESPLHIEPIAPLIETALQIALEAGCTVYDAVYIALAEQVNGVFTTSDTRLARRMSGTPYSTRVHLL
jgi:predicted nucleic acid-binding protein